MLTKITLTINDSEIEFGPDCLKNWDQITCSYKRSDFSGVIRSFTSKFEFVNDAFDLLADEYIRNRFNANVVVAIYLINDNWEYQKQFECPLDFSTVVIENKVFSVSAIDNTIASKIKANKGTKYEFKVVDEIDPENKEGDEIKPDCTFHFERIPMTESVTYAFTNGTTDTETGALTVIQPPNQEEIWMGSIANEMCINKVIRWNEDQTDDPKGYVLMALGGIQVNLDYSIILDERVKGGTTIRLHIEHINRSGEQIDIFPLCYLGGKPKEYLGEYNSESELPEITGGSNEQGKYATVNGIVYVTTYRGESTLIWENTGVSLSEYTQNGSTNSYTFDMYSGDKLRFVAKSQFDVNNTPALFKVISSRFHFSWEAKGEECDIQAFKPITILNSILRRMGTGGDINVIGDIKDQTNNVLARTILMSAESIRGIEGAKLYTSFNDFCDWIGTVFGFTYYIGDIEKSNITDTGISYAHGITSSSYTATGGYLDQLANPDWVLYSIPLGRFIVIHDGVYFYWGNDEIYNDPTTGLPLTTKLYKIGDKYYYFEPGNRIPIEYVGDPNNRTQDFQKIVFAHRSELFNPNAPVKTIEDAMEAKYIVNHSEIYSTIEIGYEKKDYESMNGRDEFNFTHTYSTGCSITDKKLSLISKYRADSYGIEFAAQKRGDDSTDAKSDSDVFFVVCRDSSPEANADTTDRIVGANTALFNCKVSPKACIDANIGFIGKQSNGLFLKFASSTGNSAIKINDTSISSNIIDTNTPLLTVGELEFITSDLDVPPADNRIKVEVNGIKYEGFIKSVEENYGREAAVKYQILVKRMEI